MEFIPLLEENHLIIQVGKWVLEEGAKQCREWQKYDPDFTMSINVSYIQLKENALLEYLKNEQCSQSIRKESDPGADRELLGAQSAFSESGV